MSDLTKAPLGPGTSSGVLENRRGVFETFAITNQDCRVARAVTKVRIPTVDRPPVSHHGDLDGARLAPKVEGPGIFAIRR